MKLFSRRPWLFLIPLVLACALSSQDPLPTAIPTLSPPTALPSATPIADLPPPTAEPELPESPTLTPAVPDFQSGPAVLPAAIYYLNAAEQIMRLEADGITLSQITAEADPIIDFDVSPADSRLAFVTGNKLVETDAHGDNRIVKVDAGPLDENAANSYIVRTIDRVRFAPDGSQIAFGLNGVNIIPAGSSADYQAILPSDPYPDPTNPGASGDGPIRFYWPSAWSPDGSKLLVEVAYFPEAGGLAISDLAGRLVEVTNPDSISCCHWAWARDGQTGFIASDLLVYGAPGLVQVDADSGLGKTIINGTPSGEVSFENPLRLFTAPFQEAGGSLLVFGQTVAGFAQFDSSGGVFKMQRVDPVAGQIQDVRDDFQRFSDVLWAPDGRGALIVSFGREEVYPPRGPMIWLPVGGAPPLDLPSDGRLPRWAAGAAPVAAIEPTSEELNTLRNLALTKLAPNPETGINDVSLRRFNLSGRQGLWLAHTVGLRGFDPPESHAIALYQFVERGWVELAAISLADGDEPVGPIAPDFLGPGSVRQVFIEPDSGWLAVDGGVGAHGGTFHLLRFDGQSLNLVLDGASAGPGAGWVADLDGDQFQEVILDQSDAYIFAYASGVRLINYAIYRWNDGSLEELFLTRLENGGEAAELNNQAIDFAESGLWANARDTIARATAAAPDDQTIRWNQLHIRTIANARESVFSAFPFMDRVFFGDYESAVSIMESWGAADLFSLQPAFLASSPALGFEEFMFNLLRDFTTSALSIQPDLAAAHFIRGWAAFQLDAGSDEARSDLRRAAELDPANGLYQDALTLLGG